MTSPAKLSYIASRQHVIVSVYVTHGSRYSGHHSSNGYVSTGYDYRSISVRFSDGFRLLPEHSQIISSLISNNSWQGEYEDDFTPAYLKPENTYCPELSSELATILNNIGIGSPIFASAGIESPFLFTYDSERLKLVDLNEHDLVFCQNQLYDLVMKCETFEIDIPKYLISSLIRFSKKDISGLIKKYVHFDAHHLCGIKIGSCEFDKNDFSYPRRKINFRIYDNVMKCDDCRFDAIRELVVAYNNKEYGRVNQIIAGQLPPVWQEMFDAI
ncbi:MAG: hypothetical protein Q4F07_02455 [Bacteroidales bacterium]|nr:hypothetical protein [Bacteroidales bacterium]